MAWYNNFMKQTQPVSVPSTTNIPVNPSDLMDAYKLGNIEYPKYKLVPYNDWILFGANNQFPIELVELRNNSTFHSSILNGKTNLIAGNGLIFADTKENSMKWLLDNFTLVPFWRKLNQVWWQTIRDQQTFGYSCFLVRYNASKTKIIDLQWIDASRIACGSKNASGDVEYFYYSDNWNSQMRNKPIKYQAFNTSNIEDDKQLVFIRYNDNNMDYYALPTYYGAVKDIKTDALISGYGLNSVSNGFSPSVAITMIRKDTPEGRRKFGDKMISNFTGFGAKLLTFFAETKDHAPIITPISTNNFEPNIEILQSMVMQKIISAHNINPVIAGVPTPGKLGYSNEVVQSWALTEALTIKPERDMMLDYFKEVFVFNGVVNLKVDTINPLKDLQQNEIPKLKIIN